MLIDEVNTQKLIKQERRLWRELQNKWTLCDRITVTKQEYEMVLSEPFTDEQLRAAKFVLLTQHEDKRIFKKDMIFIVEDENGREKEYIFLIKYNDKEYRFIIFDEDRNLISNGYTPINDELNSDKNYIKPDNKLPIGTEFINKQTRLLLNMMNFKMLTEQKIWEMINNVILDYNSRAMSFIVSLVAYIQNTRIVKEIEVTEKEVTTSNNTITKKQNNRQYEQKPRKLMQVIYQYQQKRKQSEIEGRKYNRHVDTWEVRGHYRTLRDGRRIWVRPHVKGKKDEKKLIIGKDYRL